MQTGRPKRMKHQLFHFDFDPIDKVVQFEYPPPDVLLHHIYSFPIIRLEC